MIPAFFSVSRNSHIVFASGIVLFSPKSRKRMKLFLSLIWYSVCSSHRLKSRASTKILNIITTLNRRRPPGPLAFLRTACSSVARNISQLIIWFTCSRLSPRSLNFRSRYELLKIPICSTRSPSSTSILSHPFVSFERQPGAKAPVPRAKKRGPFPLVIAARLCYHNEQAKINAIAKENAP